MFAPSLSAEQQRQLANKLTTFLSQYTNLSDSYIIEFFTEDLWATLPVSWQVALRDLSYPQVADLLLDGATRDRRYPSVWPLSLLAFRSTAHGLAFPRCERGGGGGSGAGALKPEEFLENASQSSLLGHIFRKHVKPKKQHEIRKLGLLVKQLCDQTDCRKVVDVGSGQGHLTRFLSFGLGLSVTGIEADHTLATMASRFDAQLLWALEKERQKKNSSSQLPVPGSSPRHVASWVNPKASWEAFIEQLSTAACVSEGHPTPSGPSKKRLRGSGQPERAQESGAALGPADSSAPCAVNPSQGAGVAPQQRLSENEIVKESSPNTCCVQPLGREGRRPAEDNQQACQDFVLTGLHACGDLSATLLHHFVNCPHVRGITSVACCYMKISTKENPEPPGLVEPSPSVPPAPDHETSASQFGYPMSSWVRGLPGHQLSYKAREGACHAIEDYIRRLREESTLLRTHCYRAMLETIIRSARPELRRAGIQTIKKAHMLPFTEYARLGLARVSLPAALALDLDPEQVEALLEQQGRVVVFFSLALLLAPVVETLVLLDRIIYLQEKGVDSKLVPLFDPNFSPRNFVLVALKPLVDRGGT